MPSKTLPITTAEELLAALCRDYGSRKSYAKIDYYPPSICRVVEYFDDGKGHSNAVTSETSEVDPKVFEEARRLRYILGKPMGRYESSHEFELTDNEYVLREISPLIRKGERIRWGKKSAEYMLEGIPVEYRGFDFGHAISRLVSGDNAASIEVRMAKALADWDMRNDHPSLLDTLLFLPETDSEHEFIPRDEREQFVARHAIATFFQYLGTEGGMDFLMHSLRMSGLKIQDVEFPSESS